MYLSIYVNLFIIYLSIYLSIYVGLMLIFNEALVYFEKNSSNILKNDQKKEENIKYLPFPKISFWCRVQSSAAGKIHKEAGENLLKYFLSHNC